MGQDFAEKLVRLVEKSIVIERTSAAEFGTRDKDAKAGIFQYFRCRRRNVGMEVVVERIGPQNHFWLADIANAAPAKPVLERLGREGGYSAFRPDSGNVLCSGQVRHCIGDSREMRS